MTADVSGFGKLAMRGYTGTRAPFIELRLDFRHVGEALVESPIMAAATFNEEFVRMCRAGSEYQEAFKPEKCGGADLAGFCRIAAVTNGTASLCDRETRRTGVFWNATSYEDPTWLKVFPHRT